MATEPPTDPLDLDYFPGGVPSGAIFGMDLSALRNIVALRPPATRSGTLIEVCVVALVSYFEAFAKNHFASILNICPQLVQVLRAVGYDVSVDATHLLTFNFAASHRIGFFLADKYSFGTAKEINARFSHLVNVTPFSTSDKLSFDKLLNDRNLLVHHGGIYTLKYIQQTRGAITQHERVFMDSLTVDEPYFERQATFLEGMARKLVLASATKLDAILSEQRITLAPEAEKARQLLTWWDPSDDEDVDEAIDDSD